MPIEAPVSIPDRVRRLLPAARPRKSLGQHFLTSQPILQAIAAAAEVGLADTVIEVGPGQGSLTQELAGLAARVIAVELDPALAQALDAACRDIPNVSILQADAREMDIDDVLGGAQGPYKVAASLPYYAALPILRRFLEADRPPSVMVVMVQLEVAQAMVAQPGAMSLVSIAVQTYGAPRLVCTVPPDAFHPRPKVTSAVVRIDVHGQPAVDAPDIAAFFRVVRGGFAAPRKQLRNSLAQGLSLPRESVTAMLDRAALDPTQRPADLSLDDWSRLTRALDEPS